MAHLIWTGPYRLKLRYDCVNNDSNIAPSTKIINNFKTAGHIIHRSHLDHPTASLSWKILSYNLFSTFTVVPFSSVSKLWRDPTSSGNWSVEKKKISIFNNLNGYFHKNARVLPLESWSVDQEGKHFIERQHWLDIPNHNLRSIFAENGLKEESLN